ncbi:MAG TPA: hypothetical protein VNS79_05550 [Sphingobium sp.]|nr:hypothetical protein [Sphingobium sp.]
MNLTTVIALALLGPIALKALLWANVTLYFTIMHRRLDRAFRAFTWIEWLLSFAMSLTFMLGIYLRDAAPPYLPALFVISGLGWLIYSACRAWRQSRPV